MLICHFGTVVFCMAVRFLRPFVSFSVFLLKSNCPSTLRFNHITQETKDGAKVPDNISTMVCEKCSGGHSEDKIILCDRCDSGWHLFCVSPPLDNVPDGEWVCPTCMNPGRFMVNMVLRWRKRGKGRREHKCCWPCCAKIENGRRTEAPPVAQAPSPPPPPSHPLILIRQRPWSENDSHSKLGGGSFH